MFVDGNPSLKQDNKTVYCGRIIIYPNSDKIILTDGLNVNKMSQKTFKMENLVKIYNKRKVVDGVSFKISKG